MPTPTPEQLAAARAAITTLRGNAAADTSLADVTEAVIGTDDDLAALNVQVDIANTRLTQAQTDQATAEAARDAANIAKAQAETDAAQIVADARAQAAQIIADAIAAAGGITGGGDQSALLAQIADLTAQNEAARAALKTTGDALSEQKLALDTVTDRVNAGRAELRALREKLNTEDLEPLPDPDPSTPATA